jgi:multicomponent Na+:H+ antiporter subunit D
LDPVISIRPLLAVVVACLAALAVLLLNNREKLRDVVSPLAAFAMIFQPPFMTHW